MTIYRPGLIPWLFVAFFGVVFAANGFMIWLAVSTFSGFDTENAYEKGVAYNETLKAVARQEALGWRTLTRVEPDGTGRALVLDVEDRTGRPLAHALVRARLVRPADAALDHTLHLTETAPGRYVVPLDLPVPGLWEVRSEVVFDMKSHFATDRVVIR